MLGCVDLVKYNNWDWIKGYVDEVKILIEIFVIELVDYWE